MGRRPIGVLKKTPPREKVEPVLCVCGAPPCNRAEQRGKVVELPEPYEMQGELLHDLASERGRGCGAVERADRCREEVIGGK